MLVVKYFNFLTLVVVVTSMDERDCELYAPNTMHEFCCDIHDENVEFHDCSIEWLDKISAKNDEEEMNYNYCISECIYNKTDYLGADRKSLRMDVIKVHLNQLYADEESEKLMYKTFEMCAKHGIEMLSHESVKKLEKRLLQHNCHPYPGLVFECVSNELILNCPADKYHDTAVCDHTRDYLRKCLKRNA